MDGSKPQKAYIYDACDAHYKHMCGLKDVDDKFVDSTFSPRGGCYGTRCRVRRRPGWKKGAKQVSTRPRKFMM